MDSLWVKSILDQFGNVHVKSSSLGMAKSGKMIKKLFCTLFGHKIEQLSTFDYYEETDTFGPEYIYAFFCIRCGFEESA